MLKKQRLKIIGSSSAHHQWTPHPAAENSVMARKEGRDWGHAPFTGSPHRSPSYCISITLSVSIKAQQPLDKLALFYRTLWYSNRARGWEGDTVLSSTTAERVMQHSSACFEPLGAPLNQKCIGLFFVQHTPLFNFLWGLQYQKNNVLLGEKAVPTAMILSCMVQLFDQIWGCADLIELS